MRKFLIAAGVGILLIVSATYVYFQRVYKNQYGKIDQRPMSEKITLSTSDGVTIVGDYMGRIGEPAVLMLHMMPATKESWRPFSVKLNDAGFQTLAIDLRGHGESSGGPSGFKQFSDKEHQNSINDVEASVLFLKSKNASKIFIAGASIGGNLALWYAYEHPDTQGVVLLSPGLDYRGIKTADMPAKLKTGQAVYYAASKDDPYSADTVENLFRSTPQSVNKKIKIFERAGHGTTIFEREPAFMDEIVAWLAL